MQDIFADLLVVELASVLAGPSVGMFFAELGARVIKVEHHKNGGDVTRSWKLETEGEGDRSAYFSAVNWGKESVGIDLRTEKGRNLVYGLVEKADVVIASYKPGDAEKLGMDAETLRARNPRLIYADLTAYGAEDQRVGFDAIIQAETGFTHMNGSPDGPPTKMPVALMDLLAAHQLKEGILLALYGRLRSGEGAHIRTSLFQAGVASLANQATNWLVAKKIPARIGSAHPNIVPYGTAWSTRDGREIVLAVGNDAQFRRLCACLGAPEIAEDPKFRENQGRVRHRAELEAWLAAQVRSHDRDALLEALHAAKVPVGAVRDMPDVFAQPPAEAMLLQGQSLTGVRSIALAGMEGLSLSEPPAMGVHTQAVLRDLLHLTEAEIADLQAVGAVFG
ncbi:MAG: CaiB/BaiF CoA-transferase family protein [Bacteroidota bacterium]